MASTTDLQESKFKGYITVESVSEYGGIRQRWILVDSQARRKSDIKKLDKKHEQVQQNCHQDLQVLARQDFACIADAIAVAEKLLTKMKWHQLICGLIAYCHQPKKPSLHMEWALPPSA